MDEDVAALLEINRYRSHHSATFPCSVSRVNVDVLAPQAVRAMVCVPIACDVLAAVAAIKIFFFSLKTTRRFAGHCGTKFYQSESGGAVGADGGI